MENNTRRGALATARRRAPGWRGRQGGGGGGGAGAGRGRGGGGAGAGAGTSAGMENLRSWRRWAPRIKALEIPVCIWGEQLRFLRLKRFLFKKILLISGVNRAAGIWRLSLRLLCCLPPHPHLPPPPPPPTPRAQTSALAASDLSAVVSYWQPLAPPAAGPSPASTSQQPRSTAFCQ